MSLFLCRALNLGLCSILGYQNHYSVFSAEYQIWYSNNILFCLVAQSHHQTDRIFRNRTAELQTESHRVPSALRSVCRCRWRDRQTEAGPMSFVEGGEE
jgi:hypothetical protein